MNNNIFQRNLFFILLMVSTIAGFTVHADPANEFFNEHFLPNLQTADIDGRTIAYAELGDPDGTPMLYSVGFPHLVLPAAAVYSPLDEFLYSNNVRLIFIERTGASQISTFDINDTLDTHSSDIVNLADYLGIDQFAVIGYSAGGPGALAVAALHPERVTSLHLIAHRGRYEDALADRTGEAARSAALLADPLSDAPGLVAFPPARFLVFPDVAEFYDTHFGPDYLDITLTNSFQAVAHSPEGISLSTAIGFQPWSFALDDVVAPAFVYQGLGDRVIRQEGYPQDSMARLTGPVTARFYNGENHFTTPLKVIDQVISDMQTLGKITLMCGSVDGKNRNRKVPIGKVKQALLDGFRYGNCAWQ